MLAHHDALDSANRAQAQLEKSARVTRPPRAALTAPPVPPKFESVEAATARRLEHQNNLSGPYYNPASPEYAQARAEVRSAYDMENAVKESE